MWPEALATWGRSVHRGVHTWTVQTDPKQHASWMSRAGRASLWSESQSGFHRWAIHRVVSPYELRKKTWKPQENLRKQRKPMESHGKTKQKLRKVQGKWRKIVVPQAFCMIFTFSLRIVSFVPQGFVPSCFPRSYRKHTKQDTHTHKIQHIG